jgi:diacylglycerol kinase family enzyme
MNSERSSAVLDGRGPAVPAGARRLRALLNRDGGTARKLGVEALEQQLAAGFAGAGAAADLAFLPGAELTRGLERARDDALAGRLDGVVIGGGDGSVNSAAALLAGTGVPLGVLPVGTLNHFARDLGMPLELEAAAAAIATSEPRAVDVAEVNGHVFVNNAVLGVYPYMVADRERRRERHGLGKWTAMSLAFLRMLVRFPRRRLTLCFEGESRPVRTPGLLVGVNEYDPQMFEVRRSHGLDRGQLWLLVAKHDNPLSFTWFAFRTAFRGLDEARDFEVHKLQSLEVRARTSRLPVATDGELLQLRPPLRFRIRPGELMVLAPPATES